MPYFISLKVLPFRWAGAPRQSVGVEMSGTRHVQVASLYYHTLDYEDVHLMECIDSLVFKSQLPHKIVNLLFTTAIQNIKLTILLGS